MARQVNGHLGTFATVVELTAKFPPADSIGCSANVGTAIPYTKYWCNGVEWAGVDASKVQALTSGDVFLPAVSGDMSATIQAAIDYIWTTFPKGGTVRFTSADVYECQGLVLRPRVSLQGVGTTFSEVHTLQTDASDIQEAVKGTVLRLPNFATLPLLKNDTSNGYQRQNSNVFTNGSGTALKQRYIASTIDGIFFDGNGTNQTIGNPLLYFERAWALYIKNCNIINSISWGLELADCNAVQIDNVWSHYAPWFLYDVADTQIRSCTVSGSLRWGTSIWLHGSSCSQNQFSNNLFYNSSLNTEAQWTNPTDTGAIRIRRTLAQATDITGVDGATDTQFTITSHKLYDEMPVLVSSSGTLPTGMYADRVYWVKRLSGNAFKLAENRDRCRNGSVFLRVTGAGSGTLTIDRGPAANLALTGGANKNQFNGGRVDQSYGDAILCLGAPANDFKVSVSQSGLGSTAARAGVRLRSGYIETQPPVTTLRGSYSTSISGTIDGTTTVYGGQNSNQTIGVVADDVTSESDINTYGLVTLGHSTSNYSPAHIGTKRRFFRVTNVPATRTAVGSASDQAASALASFTIPGKTGGSLGKNGRLVVSMRLRCPLGATRAGQAQLYIGSTAVSSPISLNNVSWELVAHSIYANNASNSIKSFNTTSINASSSVDVSTATIDMTANQTFEVRVLWPSVPTAGDTIILDDLSVELIESD